VDSKNAPPLKWKVTIKTDLWTLGLVTLHLLLASNELPPEDWEGTLAERMKDAIQDPDSFQVVEEDKIPADYSLRLVRLVKRMLNYRPYDRPTLHDVQEEAISQLNRLNSQYGDNILRDHHTIVRELRGEFPQQKDEFTPNQVFVPEKRRRVPPVLVAENREQLIESYRREVQVWNNTPPECTSDQLSRAFARLERELPTEVAKTNMNALSSCAKAVAVMRKTVSPDEEQDQIVNEGEQQDTEELEEFTPLTSIMKDHALFQMSQLALRVWQNEPDGELRTAFWVINHAAVIGCWVLRLGEYPTPRPEHPSSMHKAVEDWIIYDPSGLWYRRT
jgi:serine/threonine protein kinase